MFQNLIKSLNVAELYNKYSFFRKPYNPPISYSTSTDTASHMEDKRFARLSLSKFLGENSASSEELQASSKHHGDPQKSKDIRVACISSHSIAYKGTLIPLKEISK